MQLISTLDALAEQQPSARMCFVCGVENVAGLRMRFFNDGINQARAEITLDSRFQSYPGVAHGGIVAAILDEVIGRAALSGHPNRFMFTAKLEIRYRQVVPLNIRLMASARLEKDRGSLAVGVGQILLPDDTVAAEATASLMPIPAQELEKMAHEQDSWRVYP